MLKAVILALSLVLRCNADDVSAISATEAAHVAIPEDGPPETSTQPKKLNGFLELQDSDEDDLGVLWDTLDTAVGFMRSAFSMMLPPLEFFPSAAIEGLDSEVARTISTDDLPNKLTSPGFGLFDFLHSTFENLFDVDAPELRGSFVMAHSGPDGIMTVDHVVVWGDNFTLESDEEAEAEDNPGNKDEKAPRKPLSPVNAAAHTLHLS